MNRLQIFLCFILGATYSLTCLIMYYLLKNNDDDDDTVTILNSTPKVVVILAFANALIFYVLFFGKPPYMAEYYTLRSFLSLYVLHSPLILDYLRILPGLGLQFLVSRDLPDMTPEAIRQQHQEFIRHRNNIKSYKSSSLNCKVVMYLLDIMCDLGQFGVYQFPIPSSNMNCVYPISTMGGHQESLVDFLSTFDSPGSAHDYLARVKQIPKILEMITDHYFDAFHVAPKCVLEKVRNGLNVAVTASSTKKHPLIAQAEKLYPHLLITTTSENKSIIDEIEAIVHGPLKNAQHKLLRHISSLIPTAQLCCGVDALLPHGTRIYETLLRMHTTTSHSPNDIHERGRQLVANLQNRIASGLSFPNDAWDAPRLASWTRTQSCDDLSVDDILNRLEMIAHDAQSRILSRFFYPKDVPPTPCLVERLSPSREEISAGALYTPGQAARGKPGRFLINLKPGHRFRLCEMRALYFHEAVPGHHLQISLAQMQRHLPIYRQQTPWFTAYVEGWALYAESLANEAGDAYVSKEDEVGWMLMDLMRCARLVVDTGIHAKGWGRDDAVTYMMEMAGMERDMACQEVDRYISMPGQACAYKIGQLFILDLRERCQGAMKRRWGRDLDLRDFHALILRCGALPLEFLENEVDLWIKNNCPKLG